MSFNQWDEGRSHLCLFPLQAHGIAVPHPRMQEVGAVTLAEQYHKIPSQALSRRVLYQHSALCPIKRKNINPNQISINQSPSLVMISPPEL